MATPHINAEIGAFAKTVLMPGDPLRAKYIAETYLEDAVLVNNVRGVQGYTGYYKGKKVSVMASGMGQPSIGIYSYELFNFFGVEAIIRVGSCGSFHPDLHARDIIVAMGACTNGNYASQYNLPGTFCPIADFDLVRRAAEECDKKGVNYKVGNILSSDMFYDDADSGTPEAQMRLGGVLRLQISDGSEKNLRKRKIFALIDEKFIFLWYNERKAVFIRSSLRKGSSNT